MTDCSKIAIEVAALYKYHPAYGYGPYEPSPNSLREFVGG